MGKINIKIYAWLSDSFPGRTLSHVVLTESFREGETLGDLLNQVSLHNPPFAKVIFDGSTQSLYPQVNLIYNGRAADRSRHLERKLEDGDEVILVPLYAGG